MGFHVIPADIVAVIGTDDGNAQLVPHPENPRVHLPLQRNSVVHDLQEEVILSEDIPVAERGPAGLLIAVRREISRHFSRQAGGGADQALVILLQSFQIHPGTVVEALGKTPGDDLHQICVARIVLCQKNQMVVLVLAGPHLPVKPGSGRHIDLAADDGLDSRILRRTVKINDAVHGTVVGDGQAVHPQLFCPRNHLRDLSRSIQQTVFGMYMKMCECHPDFFLQIRKAAALNPCSGLPSSIHAHFCLTPAILPKQAAYFPPVR